jgi:hypothetical protein
VTTITLATIIRSQVTILRALTPATHSDILFDRCPPAELLREWVATNPGSACLRKFEIRRTGDRLDLGTQDPESVLVEREAEVVVAYPAKLPALYTDASDAELDALETMIEADARQIHDALYSPSNLASIGHQATWVTVGELEREGPVWFQVITLRIAYYEAQALQ